jgi:hypothetical protein
MRIATTLALIMIAAATAAAQAPPSFREGVLAFEKKEWATAETAMRAAVAGNPKETEGTVSIAGSWFETYVPHYFLARALAKQGKCDEALREFAESERQGVTPSIPDFARHLETRDGCKPQAKKEKPVRVAGQFEIPFNDDVPKGTPVKPVVVTPPPQSKSQSQLDAHKRLISAVASYLHGDYENTLLALTETNFTDRLAVAEAALFRAAARDALSRVRGSTNESMRRLIELDLRTYRELRPAARPDPRIFPPRFLAMARGG